MELFQIYPMKMSMRDTYLNDDGSNAYDVLFLLHDEYATKNSYGNLKRFVSNGSTIVFMDANAMYAEITYNPDLDTVTLLRGHGWKCRTAILQRKSE